MSLNWFQCFVHDGTGENSYGYQHSLTKLCEGRGKTLFSLFLHRIEVRLFTTLVAGLLLTASHFTTVQAATFNVGNAMDQVDANIGDGNCATTGGVCTLRAAIQEANARSGPHTIIVPAGTYALTIKNNIANGVEVPEDNAATGDLDIKADVTISGAGSGSTFIDGGAANDRVFDILAHPLVGSKFKVRFEKMMIQNGVTTIGNQHGGGIRNSGELWLDSVQVYKNYSGDIPGKSLTTLAGGGISNAGTLHVTNKSTVTMNHAHGPYGGVSNQGEFYLSDSTIKGNSTDSSGGGFGNTSASSRAELDGCILSDNKAMASKETGGGIQNNGYIKLTNCTIGAGNEADGTGGAIMNFASIDLSNNTISGNKAGEGGAIQNSRAGTVNLINNTISDNTASRSGGAIQSSGRVNLVNNTVTKNISGSGQSAIFLEDGGIAHLITTIIDEGNVGCGKTSNPTKATLFISEGYNIDR